MLDHSVLNKLNSFFTALICMQARCDLELQGDMHMLVETYRRMRRSKEIGCVLIVVIDTKSPNLEI